VLDLMQNVIDLNLQQGIENGLVAKLEAAMQSLDDINANNDVAAVNRYVVERLLCLEFGACTDSLGTGPGCFKAIMD
jgi:hypothetical protein